ncbi:MAG: aldolase/citrate lyase family protein [Clostridiales bacterium]|nr:aldolase/citrate lyase family protein [Clostridiales bacterium]
MNEFMKKVKAGEKPVGIFFELASMNAAECLGRCGFDYMIIDNEHGTFEGETTVDAIRGAELSGITPFVRVREISRPAIMKPLDVGAKGLIIPFVERVEDIRNIVKWAKYTPIGNRGYCPSRKDGWGCDYPSDESMSVAMNYWNEETLVIPQCETAGCLSHIEEIASMDGVDGIFIGPYDLSIGLGIGGEFDDPVFKKALERIKTACHKAGKFVIIFTANPDAAPGYFAEGYDSVTAGLDFNFYISACKDAAKRAKA